MQNIPLLVPVPFNLWNAILGLSKGSMQWKSGFGGLYVLMGHFFQGTISNRFADGPERSRISSKQTYIIVPMKNNNL